MNHSFVSSASNQSLCGVCKKDAISHTDMATCEACDNIGPVELYHSILLCEKCIALEKQHQSPEKQAERVEAQRNATDVMLEISRKVDTNIQIRTDLFNAATISIHELETLIASDETIVNKPYKLAEELMTRFTHYKEVIFELGEKIVQAGNEQKAIQVYLNNLANKLRQEEREKLKIADINYKPTEVKSKSPKPIKTSSAKSINKADLKKYAQELGVAEFTLQMLCVAKGITVEQAANQLRKSINEAKSM